MKQVVITVETQRQAQYVLDVLGEAEVDGDLDFPFGTEVRDLGERQSRGEQVTSAAPTP